MTAQRTALEDAGWSRALRDSDDASDDEGAPPHSPSPAGRTRTSSSDADGFSWTGASDAVDIGLVREPAGLKFVETPFTIAKRNSGGGARGNSGANKAAAITQGPKKVQQAPPRKTAAHGDEAQSLHRKPAAAVEAKSISVMSCSSPRPRATPAPEVAPRILIQPALGQLKPQVRHVSPTPLQQTAAARMEKTALQSAMLSLSTAQRLPAPAPPAHNGPPAVPPPVGVHSANDRMAASSALDACSPRGCTFATSSSAQATSPTPAAPAFLRSSTPLCIPTDSVSSAPAPVPVSSPSIKRVKPVKPFISPIRAVKQSRPVVPGAIPAARDKPPFAHPADPQLDVPHKKPHLSPMQPLPTPLAGQPLQVAPTSSSSRARLARFRHIGTFSSPAAPRASPPLQHTATRSSQSAAPPTSSSSAAQVTTTFHLPGIAPATSPAAPRPPPPAGRLAFAPAEPLSAFRARMAGGTAASLSSSGAKKRASREDAEEGDGRERVVLGTAVRSVRPVVALAGGSGRVQAKRQRQVGVRVVPRSEVSGTRAEESAEMRLRRLYRSMEG